MRRRFLAVLPVVFACASTVHAADEAYVELILDASGSMYNKLDDGRYRITAAKDVLKDFIETLPDTNLNVGLRIYGSKLQAKDAGSCRDSKLFVPMKGVDRAALLDTVRATRARGSTPIAWSIDQALADFPADAKRCVIVLVTDGEEACGGDLKAAAERLRQSKCDMDMHVIGFGLDTGARASFEGLGTFENAADAKALAGALDRAVVKVVEREPLAEATLEALDQVGAGTGFEVTWKAKDGPLDYVTIVPADAPEGTYGSFVYTARGNPLKLHAPIKLGKYELRYQSDRVPGVAARRPIEVVASEVAIDAPQEVPAGKPFELSWVGPNGAGDYLTIVPKDAADGVYGKYQYTNKGPRLKLHAPFKAGEYELRYQSDRVKGKVFARRPITVTPSAIVLDAPAEVGAGTKFAVQWQGPNGDGDYLTVVPTDAPDGKYTKYAYTRKGPVVDLVAPLEPGNYQVRYQSDREKGVFARLDITVVGVETTLEAPAEVAAGSVIEVKWTGPNGPGDYVTIVPADAAPGTYKKYRYTRQGSPLKLEAPKTPGDYELRYQSDGFRGKVFASRPIRIK